MSPATTNSPVIPIPVGPHQFLARLQAPEDRDRMGQTNHRENLIDVDPSMPLTQQQDTMVHEVLHAAIVTSGIVHRLDRYDTDLEEDLVCAISPLLAMALKSKALTDFLTATDEQQARQAIQ